MTKGALIEPRKLKGFRDYPPTLMRARFAVMDVVRDEARLAGFQSIATPALEYVETLLGHGEETDKQVYRFQDHGGRDVALRFDLTVPFARFVAEHQGELHFPFKKLQIGEVWRGENPQKGRYREFVQCDLDVIGVDSAAADVEILALFLRILNRLDIGPFTMAIGHRIVLTRLLRRFLGELPPEGESAALVAVDKLAKIGVDKVVPLLAKVPGGNADEGAARSLLALLAQKNAAGETDLDAVRARLAGDDKALTELTRLAETAQHVRAAASGKRQGAGRAVVDLGIARGLGYYTGVVFETTLDELPGFGSIASGGRYNELTARFIARELAGVGGSIGLDRLIAGLEELKRLPTGATAGGLVFVAVADETALGYAFELVTALRDAGLAADVGVTAKLANQFKHADRLGCPVVVTVGGREVEGRQFGLKTMATGAEQRGLPAAELVQHVRTALGE